MAERVSAFICVLYDSMIGNTHVRQAGTRKSSRQYDGCARIEASEDRVGPRRTIRFKLGIDFLARVNKRNLGALRLAAMCTRMFKNEIVPTHARPVVCDYVVMCPRKEVRNVRLPLE
jgi:hypothetical protein